MFEPANRADCHLEPRSVSAVTRPKGVRKDTRLSTGYGPRIDAARSRASAEAPMRAPHGSVPGETRPAEVT